MNWLRELKNKQNNPNFSKIWLLVANGGFENVVKTEIFLTDINDFTTVNEIYGSFFVNDPKPARQTVVVAKLPKNALIEISCIAHIK